MKKATGLKLTKEQTLEAAEHVKNYMLDNYDLEIGSLQAETLIRFVGESFGRFYYNQAVEDCFSMMSEKTEEMYSLIKD